MGEGGEGYRNLVLETLPDEFTLIKLATVTQVEIRHHSASSTSSKFELVITTKGTIALAQGIDWTKCMLGYR